MRRSRQPVLTCEGCHQPARDLPAVMEMNGVQLHVCETCAQFMEQTGATRLDAPGQGELWASL